VFRGRNTHTNLRGIGMQKKRTLWMPISGPLGRIAKALYKKCERGDLQAAFPRLTVRCIGTPFPKAPHPLLADPKHRNRLPEAQVQRSWSPMVGFGIEHVWPAQQEADIAVSWMAGLDIVTFARACKRWDTPIEPGKPETHGQRARVVQHSNVRNILEGVFGIKKPDAYAIPLGVNGACKEILLATFPDLKKLDPEEVDNFLANQKSEIEEYFAERWGQNEPLFLDATKSVDEMFRDFVDFIERRLHLYQPN